MPRDSGPMHQSELQSRSNAGRNDVVKLNNNNNNTVRLKQQTVVFYFCDLGITEWQRKWQLSAFEHKIAKCKVNPLDVCGTKTCCEGVSQSKITQKEKFNLSLNAAISFFFLYVIPNYRHTEKKRYHPPKKHPMCKKQCNRIDIQH